MRYARKRCPKDESCCQTQSYIRVLLHWKKKRPPLSSWTANFEKLILLIASTQGLHSKETALQPALAPHSPHPPQRPLLPSASADVPGGHPEPSAFPHYESNHKASDRKSKCLPRSLLMPTPQPFNQLPAGQFTWTGWTQFPTSLLAAVPLANIQVWDSGDTDYRLIDIQTIPKVCH